MLKDNILMALSELKANKLRSFLTMLGIVIGIASVIAIMTVGESMNMSMSESLNSMGANNIECFITPKDIENDENFTDFREMRESDYASDKMFEDICTKFKGRATGIAVSKDVGSGKIGRSGKDLTINIKGVNSAAEKMNKLTMVSGRDLNNRDFDEQKRVVVISSKLAEKLYKSAKNAIGEQLECDLEGKYCGYVIVGVYEHKESAIDFSISKSATDCYIPIRTAFAQLNEEYLIQDFQIVTSPGEDSMMMCEEIKDYVNKRYYEDNEYYYLDGYSNQDWIKESTDMLNNVKLALSAIAAISLIVGGIGVMNIMVVSITERTREIGTRKALGATNTSIRLQFITESIVMCLVGGTIGVIVGVGLGLAASNALKFPGVPPIKWIIISVLFSIAFGLFFGLYPAGKAAKMNPIDALRYE